MRRERACKGCDGAGCILASYDGHTHIVSDCFCPACRGTGRVTDHIPAADAVADAETLRAVLDLPVNYGLLNTIRSRYWQHATFAVQHAKSAARAAFRAVPGLRED